MSTPRYLSAKEAAQELGISLPTLYAYVSRGLIRSEPVAEDSRARRYRREDVQKLNERKELRHNPAKAAENALHWGMPIMESAITLIEDGQFYYRGHDVVVLAEQCTIEEVAALVWLDDMDAAASLFTGGIDSISSAMMEIRTYLDELTPIEVFQIILPQIASNDIAAYDLRAEAVAQTGARILKTMVATVAGGYDETGIAKTLQRAWIEGDDAANALLSAALILCADHELNVSAFTGRCAASSGATPYNVVSAGLAALQGVKHGGNVDRVEAFLREVSNPAQARATIVGRLKRGEEIPGFGHRLYPNGDPRAQYLCTQIAAHYPHSSALAQAVQQQVEELVDKRPTIDFGLAMLVEALNLPPGAGIALFALGRTIGWIGHAIEQYAIDQLIRPRARYNGRPPLE